MAGCAAPAGNDKINKSTDQNIVDNTIEDKVDLDVWIISNTPRTEQVFTQTLEPFLAERQDINIIVKMLSWETAWSDITTAIATGDGPDIVQLGTTWVPAIAAMNGLVDISDRFAKVGNEETYLPASWTTTKISGKSNIYALPWFVEARAIIYRKDALQAAGVDSNIAFENWDTFKKALIQLDGVEIDGQKLSALSITGKNDWNVAHNIFPWIWSAGGEIFTSDGKEAAFNSKNALEGVMYYTGLAQEGLVDPTSLEKNSTQIENDFADGKTAMIITGSWMLKDLVTPRDEGGLAGVVDPSNVAIAALPKGPKDRATFIGGSNLSIFHNSEHIDEAWDVIAYLSGNEEAQLMYATELGMLPSQQKLLNSTKMTEIPGYTAFAEATQYGHSYPSIPQWGAAETALVKYFSEIWDLTAGQSVLYNEKAVQTLLDNAAREINLLMSQ